MDITTKTVAELKAIAYDEFLKLETAQNNLRIINAEIAKRLTNDSTTESK